MAPSSCPVMIVLSNVPQIKEVTLESGTAIFKIGVLFSINCLKNYHTKVLKNIHIKLTYQLYKSNLIILSRNKMKNKHLLKKYTLLISK